MLTKIMSGLTLNLNWIYCGRVENVLSSTTFIILQYCVEQIEKLDTDIVYSRGGEV
jgi:hypothetical protein